jgi:molecular chaperone DnaK (HSP70)
VQIYDSILKAFSNCNSLATDMPAFLNSLKPSVKLLRRAYLQKPVYVPYHEESVQSAYLIAYFPHYYHLIYSILLSEGHQIIGKRESINIGYIGGGPGSEIYGTITYILRNCPDVKKVHVSVFDINAKSWDYSHRIVKDHLLKDIPGIERLSIQWDAYNFDITSSHDIAQSTWLMKSLDLLVIQNCLNEIAAEHYDILSRHIELILHSLPGDSFLLMSDLTSGARHVLQRLEGELLETGIISFHKSTLSNILPLKTTSVNGKLPQLIRTHLMDSTSGLIPRVNLTYDYCLVSKLAQENEVKLDDGFNVLFNPFSEGFDGNTNGVSDKTYVGIDFGTSTTVASIVYVKEGELRLSSLPIMQRNDNRTSSYEVILPSVIAKVGNVIMVGKHASERKGELAFGTDIWYGFKENLGNLKEQSFPDSLLYDHEQLRIRTQFDALVVFFTYLKREITQKIKDQGLSENLAFSVSIPADFESKKKRELLEALDAAGIDCGEAPFVSEPVASLITHVFENRDYLANSRKKRNIMILDIGAGTVDISIMELQQIGSELYSKLLAVKRNGYQGGEQIDKAIARKQFSTVEDFERLPKSKQFELTSKSEQLKYLMSSNLYADASVNFILPPDLHLSSSRVEVNLEHTELGGGRCVSLSYLELNEIMQEYWQSLLHTVDSAILMAGMERSEIDSVIISGGVSRSPHIRNFVFNCFSSTEMIIPDNIQQQVSRGTSLHSFVLNKFGKNVVTPILGNSLKIEGASGITVLFEAGTMIPSEEVEVVPQSRLLSEEKYIKVLSESAENNVKYFIIQPGQLIKLVFYIAEDYEMKCEVVTDNEIYVACEGYEFPSVPLLTIN